MNNHQLPPPAGGAPRLSFGCSFAACLAALAVVWVTIRYVIPFLTCAGGWRGF